MTQGGDPPIVLQIGFNRCGTKYLASLFERNGYRAKHWLNGALAEDIAYSKHTDQLPFQYWPQANVFADMESVHKLHRPLLEGFKEYEFLHRCFPDAIFILNERNVEEWIASRFTHQGGEYAEFHARHLGVGESELPEFWYQDWNRHIDGCTRYFAGNDRFLRFNIDDDDPEELAASLRPWYLLTKIQKKDRTRLHSSRLSKLRRIMNHTVDDDWNYQIRTHPVSADKEFVAEIVEHSVGSLEASNTEFNYGHMSDVFAEWDGNTLVTDRKQKPLPLRLLACDQRPEFLAKPNVPKLERLQGVLNELLSLGIREPVKIDMQDARRLGAGQSPTPPHPVITYNRRAGAKNLVLWPLPGYHTPGVRDYVFESSRDKKAFEDKIDCCVWRGNLTGRPNEALAPGRTRRRPSHKIIQDLIDSASQPERQEVIADELRGITRFSVVERLHESNDFDLGFTLPPKFAAATTSPLLSRFCVERQKVRWFSNFKYIASFSGHDTGSNFLMAAQSNSVVLKEEDGWELFYTSVFKPWEHYIPLALGAADIEEKLAWARENPKRCMEISLAATEICAKLANPVNRRSYLIGIFDGYQPFYQGL